MKVKKREGKSIINISVVHVMCYKFHEYELFEIKFDIIRKKKGKV